MTTAAIDTLTTELNDIVVQTAFSQIGKAIECAKALKTAGAIQNAENARTHFIFLLERVDALGLESFGENYRSKAEDSLLGALKAINFDCEGED